MTRFICIVDMSSIVYCDDDWQPNHVEHILRNHVIEGVKTDHPDAVGYVRIKTQKDFILIAFDDWEVLA